MTVYGPDVDHSRTQREHMLIRNEGPSELIISKLASYAGEGTKEVHAAGRNHTILLGSLPCREWGVGLRIM